MKYTNLKKKMAKAYSKKGVSKERKKELENWASVMCDACIAAGTDRKKMLKSQRAVDFPDDLYALFQRSKITLKSYNFCAVHLEALRQEIKPFLTKK